jgi:hypothetical protein
MSFNINELIKIRKATSNSEQSKIRIANYISQFKDKLEGIDGQKYEVKKKELIKLMNEETVKRKKALSSGVSSYSDPNWAGPSVCETLIHCLLGENNNEIKEVNSIIEDLLNSNREQESTKSNILGFLILLVASPLTFYFLNWWSGLIVVFISFVIIGWKNRYD